MANVVYLEGNLARDTHAVPTEKGTPMAIVTVAVDRQFTTANGTSRTDTAFPQVVCFGPDALYAQRHGAKGRAIAIEGAVRTRKMTTEDGNRYPLEIVAHDVRIYEKEVTGDGTGLIARDPAAGEVHAEAAQPA